MKLQKILLGAVCLAIVCMTACGGDTEQSKTEIMTDQVTEQATTIPETIPETKHKTSSQITTKEKTVSKSNDTVSKSNSVESYYCMGKNDTCKNKTYDPYDFYCSSCDPDNDNIEG